MTWKPVDQGWECSYDLLIPVDKYDIRNNGPKGKIGGGPGYVTANLGRTESSGRGPIAVVDDGPCLETPFRDGAHAAWDSFRLSIPAYVVLQKDRITYTRYVSPMEPQC